MFLESVFSNFITITMCSSRNNSRNFKGSKLLLSSGNKKKLRELKELMLKHSLSLREIELLSLSDINLDNFEVVEDGINFQENAQKKAIEYYEKSGIPTLSDDSGLIVDALNGEPGVFSARYAGENASDEQNIDFLLNKIRTLGIVDLSAKFVTVLCFYDGESKPRFFYGEVTGTLIKEKKGENGFGYDPIFIPKTYNKTFAELEPEIKNTISHRKNALDKFIDFLGK